MWQMLVTAHLSCLHIQKWASQPSSAFPPSARRRGSVCRWIKYYGIKICGSGFLSSGASTLPGNGGRDNKQETGWYTEGESGGRRCIPAAEHRRNEMLNFPEWSGEVPLPTRKRDHNMAGNAIVFFCLMATAIQQLVFARMGSLSLT